jgi:hypothetical protein
MNLKQPSRYLLHLARVPTSKTVHASHDKIFAADYYYDTHFGRFKFLFLALFLLRVSPFSSYQSLAFFFFSRRRHHQYKQLFGRQNQKL